ncbi:MAG: nicotinate (nicotinamide) nucleotide adenylyltransferase [Bacteroidales bacterium]|nr:nicotinate (nicotinamide) nucleotide adenylyltransferase [Bacteroidales bacterium]
MNIAVYSGSFNPLHIGHLAIMKYLTGEGGYDHVYLVVSPKNPLKDSISSDSGQARYDAAIEAVNRHFQNKEVKVDDIELTMPEPHYTIRTLDALREREPFNTFTLVMGADNLADIRRWRDYRRILTEYGAAVYPRTGHDLDAIKEDLLREDSSYLIDILNAETVDMSSTAIRNAIAAGEDPSAWLM